MKCNSSHTKCNSSHKKCNSSHDKCNSLKVITLNARSLKTVNNRCNKLVELQNVVDNSECDVIAVTETWLNDNVSDCEILNDNYTLYRRDRCGQRGGGVLFAVKKTFDSYIVKNLTSHEIIAVCVKGLNTNILFITCYRPPASDAHDFATALRNLLLSVHGNFKNICILGDFNFPGILWDEYNYTCSQETDYMFLKCVEDFNFVQLNNVPSTVHNHVLDLVLSNTPEMYSAVEKCDINFTSDHAVLEFSIHKISANCKGPKRYVFNYKRANYDLIKTKIQESNLSGLIQESIDVNVAWSKWHSTIMDIMNKCIPKVCVKELQSAPWFDNEVKHSRNLKLTALRKAKRTNVSSDWRKYKTLRNKHNILLGEKHDAFIVNLGSSVKQNPKRFWSFVKSKTCNRSVPNIISWDDRQAKSSSRCVRV